MAETPFVVMDGTSWQSRDDVYRAVEMAIEPQYFGRNLDALWDILRTPEDSVLQPPYALVVRGLANANDEVRQTVASIAGVFAEARAAGHQDINLTVGD